MQSTLSQDFISRRQQTDCSVISTCEHTQELLAAYVILELWSWPIKRAPSITRYCVCNSFNSFSQKTVAVKRISDSLFALSVTISDVIPCKHSSFPNSIHFRGSSSNHQEFSPHINVHVCPPLSTPYVKFSVFLHSMFDSVSQR